MSEGNSSYKPWNVEICAEIWAVRNTIMNGVKIENMVMKTVHYENLNFAEPCDNCLRTFIEFIFSGRLLK